MTRHLLAIVTDSLEGAEEVREIAERGNGDGLEVRLIAPAVEANAFRHTMGDIDEPKREAEERLRVSLATLRRENISVEGEVGDPDPVQAAEDALREAPADEVLIFEHAAGQARWYEDGLFEKAKAQLAPPLRLVVIEDDGAGAESPHVVEVERAGSGTKPADHSKEVGSAYLPNLSRSDFAGMVVGIAGTVLAAVLAAAAAASSGSVSGWQATAILIAIGLALINLAHVVGLTLFETVGYRGGFAKFFRTLALIATPAAVLTNLLILLLA
jgi:hypothetical protein